MIIAIIIVTVIVSFYAFNKPDFFEKLSFRPFKIHQNQEYFRFISHGLIHADYMHLFFNMLTLYFFSDALIGISKIIAPVWSNTFLLVFYLLSLIASSLYSYFKHKDNYSYSAIGASGAVSAMLFSFILFAPTSKIYIFFAIGVPAWLFGILYLGYEYYMGKKQMDNIGHDAHFFGAVFGIIFTLISYPQVVYGILSLIGISPNL